MNAMKPRRHACAVSHIGSVATKLEPFITLEENIRERKQVVL